MISLSQNSQSLPAAKPRPGIADEFESLTDAAALLVKSHRRLFQAEWALTRKSLMLVFCIFTSLVILVTLLWVWLTVGLAVFAFHQQVPAWLCLVGFMLVQFAMMAALWRSAMRLLSMIGFSATLEELTGRYAQDQSTVSGEPSTH